MPPLSGTNTSPLDRAITRYEYGLAFNSSRNADDSSVSGDVAPSALITPRPAPRRRIHRRFCSPLVILTNPFSRSVFSAEFALVTSLLGPLARQRQLKTDKRFL